MDAVPGGSVATWLTDEPGGRGGGGGGGEVNAGGCLRERSLAGADTAAAAAIGGEKEQARVSFKACAYPLRPGVPPASPRASAAATAASRASAEPNDRSATIIHAASIEVCSRSSTCASSATLAA